MYKVLLIPFLIFSNTLISQLDTIYIQFDDDLSNYVYHCTLTPFALECSVDNIEREWMQSIPLMPADSLFCCAHFLIDIDHHQSVQIQNQANYLLRKRDNPNWGSHGCDCGLHIVKNNGDKDFVYSLNQNDYQESILIRLLKDIIDNELKLSTDISVLHISHLRRYKKLSLDSIQYDAIYFNFDDCQKGYITDKYTLQSFKNIIKTRTSSISSEINCVRSFIRRVPISKYKDEDLLFYKYLTFFNKGESICRLWLVDYYIAIGRYQIWQTENSLIDRILDFHNKNY